MDLEESTFDLADTKNTIVPSVTLTNLKQLRAWTKKLVSEFALIPGLEQEGITFCIRPRPVGVNVTLLYELVKNRRSKGDPKYGAILDAYIANPEPSKDLEDTCAWRIEDMLPKIIQWRNEWRRIYRCDGIVTISHTSWRVLSEEYKKKRAYQSSFAQEDMDLLFASPQAMVEGIVRGSYDRDDRDTYLRRFRFVGLTMREQSPSTLPQGDLFNENFSIPHKTTSLRLLESELVPHAHLAKKSKWTEDDILIEGIEVIVNSPALQRLTQVPSILYRPGKKKQP